MFTVGKVRALRGFLVPIKPGTLLRPCHVFAVCSSPFSSSTTGIFASFFSCVLSKMSLCPSAFGFLQPQESTCHFSWGEEGACPSCSPASFLGKWIYGGVFPAGNDLGAPSFRSMCSNPGAANNLGNGAFGKTLTKAHQNRSARVCR